MKPHLFLPLLFASLGSAALADIVPNPPGRVGDTPVKPEAQAEPPAGSFDPAPFTHFRWIAATPAAGLYRLAADPELYRLSGTGHKALRLVNQSGDILTEIPWVMRRVFVPTAPRDERLIGHRVESFKEMGDGSIEIIVSLGAGSLQPVRLEIATPLRDFEKGVTVSVPGPDGTWLPLLDDGVIFDHSRFLDFRHTGLNLPPTEARRFRIRVADATDLQRSLVHRLSRTVGDHSGLTVSESGTVTTRVFRIDSLRFLSAPVKKEETELGRLSLALAILEPSVTEEGETRLVLDGGNVPLDRLFLGTEDRNFRRAVSVQIPDPATSGGWRTIHRAPVFRYEVGTFRDESLSLAFPELRSDRYRLLVEDGANAPLGITSLTGSGPAYELVFIASGGESPVLYLGSPKNALTKLSLDTAAIEAALARDVKSAPLTFGTLVENPRFQAGAAPAESYLNSTPVLWIIIALAVAVLIAVLYRALQKVEEMGEDGGEG